MNLGPNNSLNATSYLCKTYNFLKSPFRKQIDKRAARRVDFGTGRQAKREEKVKKNGVGRPGAGWVGRFSHP